MFKTILARFSIFFLIFSGLKSFLSGAEIERSGSISINVAIAYGVALFSLLMVLIYYFRKYEKSKLENIVEKWTSELESANLRLESLVRNDGLTGITNRRGFDEKIEEEWRRALRYGAHISLLMIDVDFFKHYNDILGHQEGDNALKMVASSLAKIFKRAGELVARFGGEEFVVLLPAITPEETVIAAERVRKVIEDLNLPHPSSGASNVLTVSVGYTIGFPGSMKSYQALIMAADKALYKAKHSGRNCTKG